MRIDRPAEDDTPRAGSGSRAVGVPPVAAGHEVPDRVACAAGYRAAVDAAYRGYRAAREWDEAVPALREAWENHEKKWAYPERAGPAVHPEIPGAWRGDGGRYLAPDANAEVARGCALIREVGETVITPAMRRIEVVVRNEWAQALLGRPGVHVASSVDGVLATVEQVAAMWDELRRLVTL